MRKDADAPVLTGSMFTKYFTCQHWLWFDRFGDPARRSDPSRFHEMLLERGILHEEKVIADLDYETVGGDTFEERFEETKRLMERGVERIYHGALTADDMAGEPDLLERRNDRPSRFGEYHYVPVDIKSAERLTDSMRLQLALYGDLLARVQGTPPKTGEVINGSLVRIVFRLKEAEDLYARVTGEIRALLSGDRPAPRLASGCRTSPWFKECIALAEETDDVTLLYNVKARQLEMLRRSGVRTVADAAEMDIDDVRRHEPELKRKLLDRAKLQARALKEGRHFLRREVRLPEAETEIFFDIESDPLRAVDYLYGFQVRRPDGSEEYVYQLAESPEGERDMWLGFLKWISELSDDYAVYHFGTFERARLSTLEGRYGGSDHLELFRSRMVDLNEIVKNAIVFPLYFYGIKDIGRYIGFEREGEIAGGGESVAYFERWLEDGDRAAMDAILEYNREDVVATRELKDWLVKEANPGSDA